MATEQRRTFKWGDEEYLVDDILKLHGLHKNNYRNFAKDQGRFDDSTWQMLSDEIEARVDNIKQGQGFEADGSLQGDAPKNVSIKSENRLFRKDKYTNQDITEWAKNYLNKLVQQIKPHKKEEDTSGKWDINKYGLKAHFNNQGYRAQDIFEKYDKRDKNNPDAARSFAQRDKLMLDQLTSYRNDIISKKNFDFSQDDNEWNDNYVQELDDLIANYSSLDSNERAARLRKLGMDDQYVVAFTSDRYNLSKTDEQLEEEEKKRKQEEEEKLKKGYMDEFETYAYDSSKKYQSNPMYYTPFDYSTHKFNDKEANFRNWYADLNDNEKKQYGTYLGIDNQKWQNAWTAYTNSLKGGSAYTDKNLGVLLQGTFESQPHQFVDLGDGNYLIKDSVTDDGQGVVYNPTNGYTDRIFLGNFAGNNAAIKDIYKQLAYKYINGKYGTTYEDRPDVFKTGGELIPKNQYGSKVIYNWENSNQAISPKAKENNVSIETQKARDQYLDNDNRSIDNPNAGWDAKHYARLGSAIADLGAAVTGFVPGWGTIAAAGLGVGSTITNLITDISDDAVTAGQTWKNLGLNLGMDVLGLIPGGGAASKMGKIIKTLKGTVPLIIAIPGVASMLKNSPEIAESWKKAFDGDPENGGSKMNYQDYMNILQVLNVAAGATNIARNTYKSAKKAPIQSDKIAVEVFVKDKNGKATNQKKALVLEGDDVEKFKDANEKGEAQKFIDKIEGMNKYAISEITSSNKGKFWGKDQNDKWHLFNQNPFGQTGTGRAKVLNVKNEIITDFWGRPIDKHGKVITNKTGRGTQTRTYAETGRWEADLGHGNNKNDLVYTKNKAKLDDWKAQKQADLDNQFTVWREKAAKHKEYIDRVIAVRNRIDADITTNKNKQTDIDNQITNKQQIIDDATAEAKRIQDWLDADGVNQANDLITNNTAKIAELRAKRKNKKRSTKDKIDAEINRLDAEIDKARAALANDTPDAVLAALDKKNLALTEQSQLQIETQKLKNLLNKLNRRRDGVNKRTTIHSTEYDSIKNFKPIEETFNDIKYTFDVSADKRSLDNLFRQGGTINRNKLNKFLNYGKR